MASRRYTAQDILDCATLYTNGGSSGYIDAEDIGGANLDPANVERLRLLNLFSGPDGANSAASGVGRLSGLGVRQARKSILGV